MILDEGSVRSVRALRSRLTRPHAEQDSNVAPTLSRTAAPEAMMRIVLAERGSLRRVPLTSAAEVRDWFADRVPMVLPPQAVELLDAWEAELRDAPSSIPGWRPVGPGRRPEDALPMVTYLRECAVNGESFTFNAVPREKQGGRMYPTYFTAYPGPVTISDNKSAEAKRAGRSLLVSAIRRDVRALIEAPPGWSLIELDFRSCHAAIGVALTGDEQLAADVDADVHQVIGDLAFGSEPDAKVRRAYGKELNNSMFYGRTVHGLARLTEDLLRRPPKDRTGERAWNAWWSRYIDLAAFKNEIENLVKNAQTLGQHLEIVAPSGRVLKFSHQELMGRSFKGKPDKHPDEMWRSVFSAIFRAVEGDLLDGTLRHFHDANAGGRPVLPLYDGGLFAAPEGDEESVSAALEAAAAKAAADLGVEAVRGIAKRHPS